jgi:hypothetical protein
LLSIESPPWLPIIAAQRFLGFAAREKYFSLLVLFIKFGSALFF